MKKNLLVSITCLLLAVVYAKGEESCVLMLSDQKISNLTWYQGLDISLAILSQGGTSMKEATLIRKGQLTQYKLKEIFSAKEPVLLESADFLIIGSVRIVNPIDVRAIPKIRAESKEDR